MGDLPASYVGSNFTELQPNADVPYLRGKLDVPYTNVPLWEIPM